MSNYRRIYIPGGTYFLTLVTHERRPFLTSDTAIHIFKKSWQYVQKCMPFALNAVCVLPEHIHLLITLPANDDDYSRRIKMLKSLFSIHFIKTGGQDGFRNRSRRKKGEAAIWQRRFWEHTVRSQKDYDNHFHYIHRNPVHHGLVPTVKEWKWSSFHRYVEKGFYPESWGGDLTLLS
ncbi:transposase [bacterium]|nr:transposase [bacterium]